MRVAGVDDKTRRLLPDVLRSAIVREPVLQGKSAVRSVKRQPDRLFESAPIRRGCDQASGYVKALARRCPR
jgi:hypothetical protein